MLLDTGADVSLIATMFAERLGIDTSKAEVFEVEAFDSEISQSLVVNVHMIFEGRNFRGEFLTVNQSYGIIGRNILNQLNIQFRGGDLERILF